MLGDIGGRQRTVFVLGGGVLSTKAIPDTEEVLSVASVDDDGVVIGEDVLS
jgi:hypothetical protein